MAVIILRGIPGCGKSTCAKEMYDRLPETTHIFSANDFFIQSDGSYVFDRDFLGDAHVRCFQDFLRCLQEGVGKGYKQLIVDNTNTRLWECSPYALAGEAYRHSISFITFKPRGVQDVLKMANRNKHGVTVDDVFAMSSRFEDSLPHWEEEIIEVTL